MEMRLTQHQIKNQCGTVSFRKGQTFYRTGKVKFLQYSATSVQAIVHSTEPFRVLVRKADGHELNTSCSCPTIGDFSKSCQHVAAVLIAIMEHNKSEHSITEQHAFVRENTVSENSFLSIFNERPSQASGRQRHFEKRQIMAIHFLLTLIEHPQHGTLLGVGLQLDGEQVFAVRAFLQHVKEGAVYQVTPHLVYDPQTVCFEEQQDFLLRHLIARMDDEAVFTGPDRTNGRADLLLILPSAWTEFAACCENMESISLFYHHKSFNGLKLLTTPPPLRFFISEQGERYAMEVHGLERAILLSGYHVLLIDGVLFRLSVQSMRQLTELKELLQEGQRSLLIEPDEWPYFLKQVVPQLKKIGAVELSKELARQQLAHPLVAKVYLDRVKNRLLAGVEFQYDQFVIQPLEQSELSDEVLIVREPEKEAAILMLMDDSGFTKTDGGYYMQNEELEYHFLYHQLPKLTKLAQIYATNSVKLRIVKEQHFPKIRVNVQKERTNWLEFKFEMEGVSQQQIKEILAAIRIKQKYYRLADGALLSLETREIEEIERFLRTIPAQDDEYELTFNRPLLESLPFLAQFEQSAVFEAGQSFKNFTAQLMQPEKLAFEVPVSLEPVLRDYQKHGYSWLKLLASYGFGGVLADDMGLGKTIQSIAFIVSELDIIRANEQPVLIVCPSSLSYNWLYELMRFAPEVDALVLDGQVAERSVLLRTMAQHDVVITTYPLLRRDLTYYERQHFHTVFFDEAQAFKNPATQTARTVKKIHATNRFGLTGTPIENSLSELWSIYRVIFPQLFRELEEFRHMQRPDIARRVRPFLLRRMKEQVLSELPKKEETVETAELYPEQKALYAAFLAKLRVDTLKHLDKETFDQNRIRILAGITRLRQICCHPALFVEGYKGRSAKFEKLLELLQQAKASGRRVLIFSQFTQMLKMIAAELTKRGDTYFYLDGQTPSEERVALCNAFNEGERDLFLISLKAGGTGLNLTGADTVILYDLWWNPAVEDQAADRAHRMGQKQAVQVIRLITSGTIEEKISVLQQKKKTLISEVLEGERTAAATLTEQDIREILLI